MSADDVDYTWALGMTIEELQQKYADMENDSFLQDIAAYEKTLTERGLTVTFPYDTPEERKLFRSHITDLVGGERLSMIGRLQELTENLIENAEPGELVPLGTPEGLRGLANTYIDLIMLGSLSLDDVMDYVNASRTIRTHDGFVPDSSKTPQESNPPKDGFYKN